MSTFSSLIKKDFNANKPTYRFSISANGKTINHYANDPQWGFNIEASEANDNRMRSVALGMAIALHEKYKRPCVRVYVRDERNEFTGYRLIHTQN